MPHTPASMSPQDALLAVMIAQIGPLGVVAFALPLCLSGIGIPAWLARRRGG
mgnify:CR=1 FL=1